MEAQSFGVPLGFGGPYCGVLATKEKFVRQMPGRLAGQTIDKNGKRGFVLTLATREQHIRREKATSNICTNQALVALMVNIFMTVYGKVGLRELAKQNLAKTAYAADQFAKHAKVLFTARRASTNSSSQTSEDPYAINLAPARPQNRRRPAAEEVLSRARQCRALVLHRIDHALHDRHRRRLSRRKRAWCAKHEGSRGGGTMKHITRKATRHISQNEGLIFEKSSPGKAAWKLPPLDVPEVDTAPNCSASSERKDLGTMPEVSEIEIIRHFTRLSTWNYAIDLGMFPLGSCTMKYNPRVNEFVSRIEGLANGTSLPARKNFARRAAHHEDAQRLPHRNHRHGRHHPPARRRSPRGTYRPPARPRLSSSQKATRAKKF